ncbi:MAG: SagB/ThcOx family dehydrogenase [Thaumarchaeota archaeon]|nr:SagB/ThcOx family dehydrogenase [Nitrososphaerota archaeon]
MSRFHFYNSANRPNPYKIYKDLPSIALSIQKSEKDFSALKAISANIKLKEGGQIPDLNVLAKILYFSGGITKTINFPGMGDVEFRAASCTGGLYHIEIYLVCQDIPGLEAGVYHFDPKEMKLRQLRKGDYRRVLVNAAGNDINAEKAPVILIYTDIFTRNTVKYQTREYRHAFWDCGTIIANTLAISSAQDLATKVIVGFVDKQVNSLLDLNSDKEVSLALVPIGFTKNVSGIEVPEVELLDVKTEPLSNYDVDDLEIQRMHQDSSLTSVDEVKDWHGNTPKITIPPNAGNATPLQPSPENGIPQDSLESVIVRRGSTRQFSQESISLQQLSTIIYYSTRGIPTDFLIPYGSSLIDLYIIINSVTDLESGSYFYNREKNVFELLREGKFRHVAGNLGLDQALPADGSVSLFLMSDLNKVLKRFGNRGYRAAQLEASITGGKLYLGSYTHRLGATGLTFYDDQVTEFFSPHAKGKSVMFMVVIGKKV